MIIEIFNELIETGIWYPLISLVIWLVLEMSGEMAKARKDIIDGTAIQSIAIIAWPLLIVLLAFMLPIVTIGYAINKASKIKLF